MVARYTKGVFPKQKGNTIGVEFASKNITLSKGTRVKAQIWDTAGQERYLAITSAHYRRAIGALVVYDIGKRSSFDHCEKWIQDVKEQADPDITSMLVGNKLDRVDANSREVDEGEASSMARQNGLLFKETSALVGTGVDNAFEELLEKIDDHRAKVSPKKRGGAPVGAHLQTNTKFGMIDDNKDSGCGC